MALEVLRELLGSGVAASPGTAAFARSARVVLSYGKTAMSANPPLGPNLAFLSGGSWYAVTRPSVDASARTVSASIPAASPAAASPAAAARSGRRVAADASTAWASLYAVDLVPPTRVVLTGGSLDLRVSIVDIKVGDPNPYVLIRNKDLSGYAFDWSVNTVLLGGPLVGTIVGSGPAVTYRAPAKDPNLACIPVENPVLIQVSFVDRAVGGPKTDFLKARVGILARDWSFNYSLERRATCDLVSGLTPVSFGYGSQVNARFSIGEDLKLVGLQKASSELLRIEVAKCVPSDCTTTMGPIERIDIVNLEGSSFVNLADPYEPLHLKFLLQDPGDPSFTITCPGVTTIKPEPPVTLDPREFRVPVGGGQTPPGPFLVDQETVGAVPLTPKCE